MNLKTARAMFFAFFYAMGLAGAGLTPPSAGADDSPSIQQALTIQQAMSEAISNSPVVQKAQSAHVENSWRRVEAYGGFLPSLTLDANYLTHHKYAFIDVDFGGGPITVPQIIPSSNASLTAKLPLFDGLASTNRWLSARAFEAASEKEFEWSQFQVSRQVALLFYKALGSQILKQVAENNLKTLQDHLNDVRQFKKAGVSTKFDVLRVEVQVSEAESELLNAQDNEALSKNRLAEVFGKEEELRSLNGLLPVFKNDLISAVKFDSVPARADLVALQSRAEGFDDLNRAAGRFWVPRLNLFGQYQLYNNRNDRFNDLDNYREAYQVGVNMTWNVFDGMTSAAKSQQAVEQKFQAEKQLQIARLKSKQDFELWRRKFLYFCSVYHARLNDVGKAEESVRLAREGRRVGARTNTDLLDAESELFRARAGQVNAQIGAIESLINLELTTGQKIYEYR